MTPRETLVLLCSHYPINDSSCYLHNTVYLAVTLPKGSYIKSWWIVKLHNFNFVWYRSQGFPERDQSGRNFPLLKLHFMRTIDLFFIQWVYYSLTAIHTPYKYLLGTIIFYEKGNGGNSSTSNLFASGIKEYHLLIYFYIKVGR